VCERWGGAPLVLFGLDSLAALKRMGGVARARWGGRVAAVTGSAGKTTTKDAIAHLLESEIATGKTEGNLNNHVGVPLSILRLPEGCRAAVLEMGMNHAGEIRRLAAIAAPDVGVVTNVGPVHLEGVGGFAGVVAAKGELLEQLAPAATAVLNADDPSTPALAARWTGRTLRFGLADGADVRADHLEQGSTRTVFTLRFPGGAHGRVAIGWLGEHNVRNALAAAAAAHCLGADLAQVRAGLAKAKPAPMRFEVRAFEPGVTVVNDAYNANPASMRAALAALARMPRARRLALVLGDMLELGAAAAAEHRALGRDAAAAAPDLLLAVGAFAGELAGGAREAGLAPAAVATANDAAAAAALLGEWLRPGDRVLLKASRGVRLERVLERLLVDGALREAPTAAAGGAA